ncbi:MAG: tetratricopeptide repeat protein [Myxococcales bacterium]|nr:tetratricopeptide repeat protein [Myxococcales bacterium]
MTRLIAALAVTVGLTSAAWAQDFEAAGKHFSSAQEAFGAKHYRTAAAEFEAAYGITKDPVLLYNVAESYEKAGDGRKAASNYKAYLRDQPQAADKAEVQRRVKNIEGRGYRLTSQSMPGDSLPATTGTTAPTLPPATPAATPPPSTATTPATSPPSMKEPGPAPPSTPPPSTATTPPSTSPPPTSALPPTNTPPVEAAPVPERAPEPAPVVAVPPAEQPGLLDEGPTSKMRVGAWIGVASTLAVLTAGAIFGLAAQSRADEINRRLSFVDMNGQPHKFDQSASSDLQSLKDDGNLYNGLAIGFYSVAAVSAVITITLFVVDAKRPKPARKNAFNFAPVVGKNAGGFALGGTF